MYDRIIVAVDMNHRDRLNKAIDTAAGMGKAFDAEVYIVAVTGKKPHDGSPDTDAFQQRVDELAREKGEENGITLQTKVIITVDPYSDLNKCLYQAMDELEADAIVLASHEPGIKEFLLPSTSSAIVKHTDRTVVVVR